MLSTEAPLPDRLQYPPSSIVHTHHLMQHSQGSVHTASELAERLTPTSHGSQALTFRHHELEHASPTSRPITSDMPTKPMLQEPSRPVALTTRSAPIVNHVQHAEQKARSDKVGLGKRVGSFVRSTLHRSHSNKDASTIVDKPITQPVNKPAAAKEPTHLSTTKMNPKQPAVLSTPAIDALRSGRRHSSFLPSRRPEKPLLASSPSTSGSPPKRFSMGPNHLDTRPKPSKTSLSSTVISSTPKVKPGITWAGNGHGKPVKKPVWSRRRSASTDQVPRLENNGNKPTAGMLSTFSKPPDRGVGVKARRLSMSLPDDFIIDCCDLDKEFKSSSLMPGKRGEILGKGATSEVRIMARKSPLSKDELLVAVKEYRERDQEETEEDYVLKIKSEYSIAKSLHHPNIVETVRLCTNRGRWNHVMEFCTYGEVYSLVERKLFGEGPEGFYSDDDRLCFFKQLLRGIDFLHSHGIAHRDIKLENLLLDKDGRLKISDFGVAEVFSGEHPGLRASGGECGKNMKDVRLSAPGICGSLPYIAPEVLEKNHSYDPRPLDVWSSAIVYLTMTFGGCPWKIAKTEFEYYARFKKGWDQWLAVHPTGHIFDGPDGHPMCGKIFNLIDPPPLRRIMLRMLHPMPARRITVRQALETRFIQNINCCCPESFDVSTAKTAMSAKQFTHRHIPPKVGENPGRDLTQRFDGN